MTLGTRGFLSRQDDDDDDGDDDDDDGDEGSSGAALRKRWRERRGTWDRIGARDDRDIARGG